MTFVSIIVPFNKSKRYLTDCLESLAEQNLDDSEVILIVNGCDEDIGDLLDLHSSKLNLTVRSFDEAINVASARNEGLKLAQGKYVYFIDSDDYIYMDGLSRLVDVARKSGADFINGERMNTAFIRQRFPEELVKENRVPSSKGQFNDRDFSFNLIVGKNTNQDEFISILHALIRRDLIENIFFDESERYDSDYGFLLDILDKLDTFIGVEGAFYAKRIREDPINLTSLNQEKKQDNFLMKCNNYQMSCERIAGKEKYRALYYAMTRKLFGHYAAEFVPSFLASPNNKWRNEYFDKMSVLSRNFDILNLGFMDKRAVKALKSKDKKAFRRIVRITSSFDKLKVTFSSREKFYIFLYKLYNKKPVNKRQIIFESFRGYYYSDSPKYIYEYLYENYGDEFDFVWVINDPKIKIPGNPKRVKRFSLKHYMAIARSKYWVFNGRQPLRFIKKKDQVLVSTWHGTPLKRLGLDLGNVYTEEPNIKKSYIKVARPWDYLISPNSFTTAVYRSAFAYEGEIIEEGYPRNDILYSADENSAEKIKSNLNLPGDKKIILYAPTWRDDEFYERGKVKFELNLELDKMRQALGDDYIVLIRMHYFIAQDIDLSDYEGFAFNVSDYDDIGELYLISDILITDYSSVFFDYANLKRPILFYTYDLEKYENVLRGFYIDIRREVPGPLVFTTEEIIDKIINIDELKQQYAQRYDEFYDRFCSLDDGNASKRIVEKIWKK